jgi:hypothetical protein
MSIPHRLAWALLLATLLLPGAAAAELIPGFHLTYCTGAARVIVRGQLDKTGTLTVVEVYSGHPGKDKRLALRDGAELYARLNSVKKQGGALEVVAFLRADAGRGWEPVHGEAGVVRLEPDGVYALLDADELGRVGRFPTIAKHPRYTRTTFLAALKAALDTEKERGRLLALPRSAERARKLLALLNKLESRNRLHHLYHISGGLRPAHAAEEQVILTALKKASQAEERVWLLRLIADVPLTVAAFEPVAVYLDRKFSSEVRRGAMDTLRALDAYRAAGRLAPLLSLNEPELANVLSCLTTGSDPWQNALFNARAAEGLFLLANLIRQAAISEGGAARNHEIYLLLMRLREYAHPRHVAALYTWALAGDHSSCDRALTELQRLTGLKYTRTQRQEWLTWWRKAGPLLEAPYDLRSATGRQRWLSAYQGADPAARRLLRQLWLYEKDIDEAALLKAATGKQSVAAKDALAELWERGRLAPASRQALVEKFLGPELVEQPPSVPNTPAWRDLRITIRRDFPFPKTAWVQPRSSITVNGAPRLADSWGAVSLGDAHTFLGSMSARYTGAPSARALLEVREVVPGSNKALWTARWSLGPIKLRRAP